MSKKNNIDLEDKFGNDARALAFSAEVSFINDDGLRYLIEENSAKIKKLTEQNERLREELFRRADEKENKTKND